MEEIRREALPHVFQEGEAVAHSALASLGPHDLAFQREGAQPDLEHQVDGGAWGDLDGEFHHQSPGADSPYRSVQFIGPDLTAPAEGRQADRESAKASPPGQMPPQGFHLRPNLHLMPPADPVGDPWIVERLFLTDQCRHALFFAIDADDSHWFPHFLPDPHWERTR
jgi:hypothetical protein